MQSPLFEPTNLPTIEQPSPIAHAIFEEPLLLLIGLGALGLILLLALMSRGKAKAGIGAFIGSLVLCGGIFGASQMVLTDREMIAEHAQRLVDAVSTGDQFTMRDLMTQNVRVESSFANANGIDRVITLAATRVPNRVDSQSVREMQVDLPGSRVGRSMIKIRASVSGSAALSSWWMIQWEREDAESSEWKASHIKPLWIQGFGS